VLSPPGHAVEPSATSPTFLGGTNLLPPTSPQISLPGRLRLKPWLYAGGDPGPGSYVPRPTPSSARPPTACAPFRRAPRPHPPQPTAVCALRAKPGLRANCTLLARRRRRRGCSVCVADVPSTILPPDRSHFPLWPICPRLGPLLHRVAAPHHRKPCAWWVCTTPAAQPLLRLSATHALEPEAARLERRPAAAPDDAQPRSTTPPGDPTSPPASARLRHESLLGQADDPATAAGRRPLPRLHTRCNRWATYPPPNTSFHGTRSTLLPGRARIGLTAALASRRARPATLYRHNRSGQRAGARSPRCLVSPLTSSHPALRPLTHIRRHDFRPAAGLRRASRAARSGPHRARQSGADSLRAHALAQPVRRHQRLIAAETRVLPRPPNATLPPPRIVRGAPPTRPARHVPDAPRPIDLSSNPAGRPTTARHLATAAHHPNSHRPITTAPLTAAKLPTTARPPAPRCISSSLLRKRSDHRETRVAPSLPGPGRPPPSIPPHHADRPRGPFASTTSRACPAGQPRTRPWRRRAARARG